MEVGIADISLNISNMTIIYIEDNMFNQFVFKEILDDYYTIKIFDSGEDFLKSYKYDRDSYDDSCLFVIDLNLGHLQMRGEDLLGHLNEIDCFKRAPKIAYTAYAYNQSEVEKIISQGFNICLPKPANKEQLLRVLKKFTS
ncbi:MAG: response regulator [Cyclobacteriaceae bacterium]